MWNFINGVGLAVVLGMIGTAQAEPVTLTGKVAITGTPYKVDALVLKTGAKGDIKVELNPTGLEMAFYDGKEVEATGELADGTLTVKSYRNLSARPAGLAKPEPKGDQVPGLAPETTAPPSAGGGKGAGVNKPRQGGGAQAAGAKAGGNKAGAKAGAAGGKPGANKPGANKPGGAQSKK